MATGESVIIHGIGGRYINVPIHRISLDSNIVRGLVEVGVVDSLPMKGISMLLGNDLAGERVVPHPRVMVEPNTSENTEMIEEQYPGIFPACAVTRAQSAKRTAEERLEAKDRSREDEEIDLSKSFMNLEGKLNSPPTDPNNTHTNETSLQVPASRQQIIQEQWKDDGISPLFEEALPKEELEKIPSGYFIKNGVLMRKWRPPQSPAHEDWAVIYQLVLPKACRAEVLEIAHKTPLGGHLGIRKTYDRITKHFYWPEVCKDVSNFCRTCHTCQMAGKPNQKIPIAPLHPIPAFEEPFCRVLIDCVGPLPKTKRGNQYIFTILCASTRFPEAVPLRNISAEKITRALLNFFSMVGLPRVIQSDQGSNFMSRMFRQSMSVLGVQTVKSSAYHPQSQGALERFHSTLKTMIRTYCLSHQKDWDEGIPFLMFAARDATQESLGFSPFELIFGHSVRGPLALLKEKWLQEGVTCEPMLEYVSRFRNRLYETSRLARERLRTAQARMKQHYDRNTTPRTFKVGDNVLVLLPLAGHPLKARFHGPYTIARKVSELNYIINTPDRRKATKMCHINMLKPYFERDKINLIVVTTPSASIKGPEENSERILGKDNNPPRLSNSEILANLTPILSHLTNSKRNDMIVLIRSYSDLFPDVPKETNIVQHDVEIEKVTPIKQHPYRVNFNITRKRVGPDKMSMKKKKKIFGKDFLFFLIWEGVLQICEKNI